MDIHLPPTKLHAWRLAATKQKHLNSALALRCVKAAATVALGDHTLREETVAKISLECQFPSIHAFA